MDGTAKASAAHPDPVGPCAGRPAGMSAKAGGIASGRRDPGAATRPKAAVLSCTRPSGGCWRREPAMCGIGAKAVIGSGAVGGTSVRLATLAGQDIAQQTCPNRHSRLHSFHTLHGLW
eukprot:scaffold247_cov274-Pinguiococcus_pyrenoidosus.AAC.19